MANMTNEFLSILTSFGIDENIIDVSQFGDGHINVTWLVTCEKEKYILQKMNVSVFKDPDMLMNNVVAVTTHLQKKGQETPAFLQAKDGKYYVINNSGYYRIYRFIPNSKAYEKVENRDVFRRVGAAFGKFQKQLADFDASVLGEVIPNFHNTPKRYGDFCEALAANKSGRAENAKEEIAFFQSHADMYAKVTDAISDGRIPLRVTHNDTKLNNILIDTESGEARCVIDLDTIMPGSMLYDFGDSIRFGASTASEDEQDLAKVHFDLDLFRAYAEGFLPAVADALSATERELVPYSAFLLTAECGMRFLGDYINGDTYFSTKYPEHNLVRARTQIRLASEMEKSFAEMGKIVDKILQ